MEFLNMITNKSVVMKNRLLFLLFLFLVISGCRQKTGNGKITEELIPISEKALNDTSSAFYAHFNEYPQERSDLPIGVFDSGTGGLTVLEAMLSLDAFNNKTGESGADGVPDFSGEKFIYLADQINMPYGNYAAENKTEYLRELVIKDALFLTSPPNRSKLVVIACNTATAYGLQDVSKLFQKGETGINVIGVINAAVNAVYDGSSKDDSIAVGVMATVGTIASGGYERTLKEVASQRGYISPVVVNQGGKGFAEAVDGEYDYIERSSKTVRDNYRGPAIGNDTLSINPDLMEVYNFDMSNNALLVKKKGAKIETIQLNSPGNYARYHLVNMIDKYRQKGEKIKIGKVILGCTHYPYFKDTLEKCLGELRKYSKNGIYPYRDLIKEKVEFIDPARNVAIEAYNYAREHNLLNPNGVTNSVMPYITVPADTLSLDKLDKAGNFKYEFKYGRASGTEKQDFSVVPFSSKNINKDNLSRIQTRLPLTYSQIKSYTE